MLFPEEDTTALKTWIVKRLETPSRTDSDVDADVLADYVLALLWHDGGSESVKQLCETELYDFLKDAPFVADVFRAITYKSYLPGARATPSPQSASNPKPISSQPYSHSLPPAPGTQLTGSAPSFVPGGYAPARPPGVTQSYGYGTGGPPPSGSFGNIESRKRSYHDSILYNVGTNGSDAQNFQSEPGGRATKQARRGGSSRGGRGGTGRSELPEASNFSAPPPEEILRMQQQLGLSTPMFNGLGFPTPGNQSRSSRKSKRCRIMEQKGTCTKPNCPFDHGDNFAGMSDPFMGMFPFFPPLPPFLDHSQQQQHLVGAKRERRGGKSQLAADGPVYDKTRSTIIVQGIPDDYLTEDAVNTFFSQFGSIESVQVQVPKKTAIIKFRMWEEANAAYQSPKVIFDNRFVKVFWLKDEAAGKDDAAEPELDLEEFQRKQDEAQRIYEEKLRKKQEIDQQRNEIGERMKELFERQAKERQRLVTMMAMATAAKNKNKSQQASEDGSGTNTPTTASKQGAITQTDLIRAQLAALEEEARMLGLDPDAILGAGVGAEAGEASDDIGTTENGLGAYSASTWQPRGGGYTPRGRGSYRGGGRGSGYAGGYTRGKNASVYAAYSLDNRPRRVAVAGVDFSAPAKDEALRQYLLGIGDFAAIDTTENAATITFVDRRIAEQFYYSLPRAHTDDDNSKKSLQESLRKLPGVDTPVEVRWVANTPGMATGGHNGTGIGNGNTGSKANADSFTINTLDDEDDDNDDNHSPGYMDREDGEIDDDDNDNRHQNMDFDVAGDEAGWDIA